MAWPKRSAQIAAISKTLEDFSKTTRRLSGIRGKSEREALSTQIVASIRREDYFALIQNRGIIGPHRADPNSPSFDPELAVVHFIQRGALDDAAWLIFLMVYIAKPSTGWQRLSDIYGKLGQGSWDWATVSRKPDLLEQWLAKNWSQVGGKFGNHRKYESLDPDTNRPMGPAVTHYIKWVAAAGGHRKLLSDITRGAGNDPHMIFDAFFRGLPVTGFGRLGRFDWTAMLARYGLISAKAGTAYLSGATGPRRGVALLFEGDPTAAVSIAMLQIELDRLDQVLQVGMEVLEDALCNWQKSPAKFVHFKG